MGHLYADIDAYVAKRKEEIKAEVQPLGPSPYLEERIKFLKEMESLKGASWEDYAYRQTGRTTRVILKALEFSSSYPDFTVSLNAPSDARLKDMLTLFNSLREILNFPQVHVFCDVIPESDSAGTHKEGIIELYPEKKIIKVYDHL